MAAGQRVGWYTLVRVAEGASSSATRPMGEHRPVTDDRPPQAGDAEYHNDNEKETAMTNTTTWAAPTTRQQPPTWSRRAAEAARRTGYAALALPISITLLLAIPLGKAATIRRLKSALAERLLRVPTADTGSLRMLVRSLPADVLAFILVAPAWGVFLVNGVLYPVFDADHLERSWGGPTLAGAWVAHFIQGPPLILVITLLLWPISRWQAAVARG